MKQNEDRGYLGIWIIIIVLIIGAIGYYFNYGQTQEVQDTSYQEEISESDLITSKLAKKYQAMTDWEEEIDYTIDAQKILSSGKTVLFTGQIDDVLIRDEKSYIRLSSSWISNTDYIAEFECDSKIINKFLDYQANNETYKYVDEYGVVAVVDKVVKPTLALRSEIMDEDYSDITFEYPDIFIVKGVCLDIEFISSL